MIDTGRLNIIIKELAPQRSADSASQSLSAAYVHATIYSSHPPAKRGTLSFMKKEQAELDHLHVPRWVTVMMGGPLAGATGNTPTRHSPAMFVFT